MDLDQSSKLTGRPLPPRIAIEAEMNRFIRDFGGELVSEMVGTKSPAFLNADYWLKKENVIVELKCLTEDKTEDRRLQNALDKLFNEFIDSGKMPDPGSGIFRVASKTCPFEFQREIYKLFARPIKDRMKKANRQIKDTRKWLWKPDAYGLVLLANDGNYRLEPNQLMYAVDIALGQNFSAVEGVVVFTVNMLATTPVNIHHEHSHTCVWIPAYREGYRDTPDDFLTRLHQGWAKHIGKLIGEDIPIMSGLEHEDLGHVIYDQCVSKAIR